MCMDSYNMYTHSLSFTHAFTEREKEGEREKGGWTAAATATPSIRPLYIFL